MKTVSNLFRALGDVQRLALLERLRRRDGQRLAELAEGVGLKRSSAAHHLRVLEGAGLVVSARSGRERRYALQAEPLLPLADGWLRPYLERWWEAGGEYGSRRPGPDAGRQGARLSYQSYIRCTPGELWAALTVPMITPTSFFGLSPDWLPDGRVEFRDGDGTLAVVGDVLEWEPPWRLSLTWQLVGREALAREGASVVSLRVDDLGGMCRLTVRHEGFGRRGRAVYRRMAWAWRPMLDSLKSLLETRHALVSRHRSARRRGWRRRRDGPVLYYGPRYAELAAMLRRAGVRPARVRRRRRELRLRRGLEMEVGLE